MKPTPYYHISERRWRVSSSERLGITALGVKAILRNVKEVKEHAKFCDYREM